MSERECGECTACCEGWLYSEKMNLRPGSRCVHCSASGCGIYDDRPEAPCRKFRCAWLADGETVPDEMRPDQCGAIIMLDRKWNGWNIIKAVPTGEAIPDETMEWLKAYARKNNIPLLFQYNLVKDGRYYGQKYMGYGPPAFLKHVEASVGIDDIIQF